MDRDRPPQYELFHLESKRTLEIELNPNRFLFLIYPYYFRWNLSPWYTYKCDGELYCANFLKIAANMSRTDCFSERAIPRSMGEGFWVFQK